MTVTSGTYVRSLVHDIGAALGSAAHVVELIRTRQGQFTLDPDTVFHGPEEDKAKSLYRVIPWSVLDQGIQDQKARNNTTKPGGNVDADADSNGADNDPKADSASPWETAISDALQ